MVSETVLIGAVVLVSLTSMFVLISRDWRYCLIALSLQYIGVFLLVDSHWPVEMAVAKMVAGWMSVAILGIAMASTPPAMRIPDTTVKFGPIFRLLAAILVTLTISSLVIHSGSWLSMVTTPIQWGSLILIGFGILQLGLTSHPLRVIIGLLTALSGFEIMYSAVETSTLVTGLLAGVNLGLALVGAYLLVAPTMEANP